MDILSLSSLSNYQIYQYTPATNTIVVAAFPHKMYICTWQCSKKAKGKIEAFCPGEAVCLEA